MHESELGADWRWRLRRRGDDASGAEQGRAEVKVDVRESAECQFCFVQGTLTPCTSDDDNKSDFSGFVVVVDAGIGVGAGRRSARGQPREDFGRG